MSTCDDVAVLSGGIGQGDGLDCIAGDVVGLHHRRSRNHPLRDSLRSYIQCHVGSVHKLSHTHNRETHNESMHVLYIFIHIK